MLFFRTGILIYMKNREKCNLNSAQDLQDKIFRRMTADRRLEVGSMLWKLAKDLVGNKIDIRKDIKNLAQG